MMQCHELARWRFRLVYRLTRHDHETAPTEIVVGAVDDNLVPRDRRCRGYIRQRERFGLCVDRHLPQVAQVLWLIDGAIQQQAGHFQAQAIIRVRHLLHLRDERELWLASRLLNDHPGILQYLAIHPVEIDSLAILRCKRPIRPVALTVGQCFPFCVVPLNYWRRKVARLKRTGSPRKTRASAALWHRPARSALGTAPGIALCCPRSGWRRPF